MISLFGCRLYGTSLGSQPLWPCDRDLEEVDTLHEWNNEESLNDCIPNTGSLLYSVNDGEKFLSCGCGTGKFAYQFAQQRRKVNVIVIGSHDINKEYMIKKGEPENIGKIKAVYHGYVPEQMDLIDNEAGQFASIEETYGPVTYYDDPAKVLAYVLYLLKKNGQYSCITSTTKDGSHDSVFGTRRDFDVVKRFFIDRFGTNISLIDTKIRSRTRPAQPDGKPTTVDDTLIRLRFKGHDYVGVGHLEQLFDELAEKLGKPKKNTDDAWFTANRDFSITAKTYPDNQYVMSKA